METKPKSIEAKLLEIQEEVGAVKKDQTNPHFKNTYYDINSLLAVIKPLLNTRKILLSQPLVGGDMETILHDVETGATVSYKVTLPTNPDPQKMGAIISYFRRYSLTSMLALEAEDTDANDTAVAQVTRGIDNSKIPETVVGGGSQDRLCVECGAKLTLIPDGVSKSTGRAYKAFWACKHKHKQF